MKAKIKKLLVIFCQVKLISKFNRFFNKV